jgi:hypothetical protein
MYAYYIIRKGVCQYIFYFFYRRILLN